MHAGNNKIKIPHKIDTGSDCNIIPWYMFKKLFPRVTEAEHAKTIKNHIKLKMYNKTVITQLGTCVVIIKYKDHKKKCEFFVVTGNGQVLLGMLDTAALNIINVNIDSIDTASMQNKNCNTNISDTKNQTPSIKLMGQRRAVQTLMRI